MGFSVEGVLVLVVFYILVLVIGILAPLCVKLKTQQTGAIETSLTAGRDLNGVISVFTMIATTVGGGYINGTAESVATSGIVWTLAPLGIFLGLNLGGIIYAKPMREKRYVTMLDPIQQAFGCIPTLLVYMASLWGDLLWTAAILSALGTSLSTIAEVPLVIAVCVSAGVAVLYTMIGNMVAVAYTDVVQLCLVFVGLVISIPFVLTNENIERIELSTSWVGTLDSSGVLTWIDLLIAMTFGTIPWQAYFQRVLSVRTPSQAVMLSVVGAFGALLFAIPSVLIGAAGTTANWTNTAFGHSPLTANASEASKVLPLVLKEFTPPAVSVLGLGAISAAVMSSMDSSILGSSGMFTHNIYQTLIRTKATDRELMIVQRLAVLFVGISATAISLSVSVIYGLFILAADIVFVIILPQLTYALFLPERGNMLGAIAGFFVGAVLRFGAGEPTLGLQPFILYSNWDPVHGQSFPFRTVAMLSSALTIIIISELVRGLRGRMFKCGNRNLPRGKKIKTIVVGEKTMDTCFSEQDTALIQTTNCDENKILDREGKDDELERI